MIFTVVIVKTDPIEDGHRSRHQIDSIPVLVGIRNDRHFTLSFVGGSSRMNTFMSEHSRVVLSPTSHQVVKTVSRALNLIVISHLSHLVARMSREGHLVFEMEHSYSTRFSSVSPLPPLFSSSIITTTTATTTTTPLI